MLIIEIIAVLFSLISIVQTIQQNKWCWITGLVGIIAYMFLFADQKLYCQLVIQLILIVQSIYGIINWGKTKEELPVTHLKFRDFIRDILITGILGLILWYFLKTYTNENQALLDVATSLLTLLATWYLTKKYIDNWIIWIITDIYMVIMFANEKMYLSAVLYLVFLWLAFKGLMEWVNDLKVKV